MTNTSVLEYVRSLHADIERAEKEIEQELLITPRHPRQSVIQQHFISQRVREIQETSKTLLDLYENGEEISGLKAESGSKLSGSKLTGVLKIFEERLSKAREYHKSADARDRPLEEAVERANPKKVRVAFSGEEAFGKYVDLLESYREFVDLLLSADSTIVRPTYAKYLEGYLNKHAHVPAPLRQSEAYQAYLQRAAESLSASHLRAYPLDTGTLAQAANIPPSDREGCLSYWAGICRERIRATIERQEKKPGMRTEELEAEESREVAAMLDAFEKSHQQPSGPKTAEGQEEAVAVHLQPNTQEMTWDGKPLPKWLINLHGLNKKFPCEICNRTYKGPHVYEEHFQGPVHTHFLAKLGIPQNTKHFNGVSTKKEALALWERMKKDSGKGIWRREAEEFEDDDGQFFTQGMYQEMKRQGILP